MRTLSLSWSSARQGLITSGLNHVMHAAFGSPNHEQIEKRFRKFVSQGEYIKATRYVIDSYHMDGQFGGSTIDKYKLALIEGDIGAMFTGVQKGATSEYGNQTYLIQMTRATFSMHFAEFSHMIQHEIYHVHQRLFAYRNPDYQNYVLREYLAYEASHSDRYNLLPKLNATMPFRATVENMTCKYYYKLPKNVQFKYSKTLYQ